MVECVFSEREIIFLANHQALALVGKIVIIVATANAYNRIRAQVSLTDALLLIRFQVVR